MGGNIVLAHMLSVYDFTLLAMVGLFTAVANNLSSCGLSDWLIRQPNPRAEDYSTVFVFNSTLGFLFGIAFFFSGGALALWFEAPELVPIMRAIGICFFLGSMTFVQEARLRKLLDMRTMALVKLCSTASAVGLGIWLAWAGYGYWALVSCRIFLSAFILFFYMIFTRWWPGIRFDFKAFREMFRYGVNLLVSYLGVQISNNINTFVLGKTPTNDSGYYSQAQKMEEVPFNIVTTSITGAFFPVVANETDPGRRRTLVREMGVNILLINISLFMFMFVVAPSGFQTLFGHKWDASVPIFRVIISAGLFMAVKQYIFTILKYHNATRPIRDYMIGEVVLQLILLACAWRFGVLWIAASQVIAYGIVLIALTNLFRRYEPGSLSAILRESARSLYAPATATAIVLVGQSMWGAVVPAWVSLVLTTSVFGSVFWVVTGWIKLPVYERMRRIILRK